MPELLMETVQLQDGSTRSVPLLRAGKPVVKDGSEEFEMDPQHFPGLVRSRASMGELRTKLETAEEKLAAQDSILRKFGKTDEERARTLELAGKAKAFDDKKLIEAGEIEKVVNERIKTMAETHSAEIGTLKTSLTAKEQEIARLMIDEKFGGVTTTGRPLDRSTWLLTESAAKALFRENLKVENGKLVAYKRLPGTNGADDPGEKIFNASGGPATFDEALTILRDSHPERDQWQKSTASGAEVPGGSKVTSGKPTMPLAQFQNLNAQEKSDFINKQGGVLTD